MDDQTKNTTYNLNRPKVSIITVCFNSQMTIERTIQSVIAQAYPNTEYIIVDGGSCDGTIDIIKNYEQNITKWISEPDKGIYDAMNKGINIATGVIIGLLNSDDYLEPYALSEVVNSYLENRNADIFCGNMRFIEVDKSKAFTKKSLVNVKKDFIYGRMPVCHPATFVTKSTYDDLGFFNTEYRNAADYEFILRCINKEKKFIYIDRILSNMCSGGASSHYIRTFNETRRINMVFGCNPIIAWLRFIESCTKTIIFNFLSKYDIFYNSLKFRSLKQASKP